MLNIANLPIGVFDSGVGGLTVLKALRTKLPQESFIYLGDTARLPYGTKSADTVIRYAIAANRLLVNRGIKFMVVACNTATTLALQSLLQTFPDLPIIGVVEPGAQAALAASKNKKIAVIATEATVNAGGYQTAIKKFDPKVEVIAQACSLFVALAEEGWTEGPIVEGIARQYLHSFLFNNNQPKVDCLILGCTHFPTLHKTIAKITGDRITLIDSAEATSHYVKQHLTEQQLIQQQNKKSKLQFLVTDSPERFMRFAKIFLGENITPKQIELVDI